MRKNFGAKPLMFPQPVMIIGTYDQNGVADAMNAAWGGIADYQRIAIYLSPSHKTVKNILEKKEFTVSMATEEEVIACDYVGMVSGNNDVHKLDKTKWTIEKSEFVDAPIFKELPMSLECRLESYDEETTLLMGLIVNVSVDETVLTEDGKVDLSKLKPITYDASNSAYVGLGKKVGNSFSDGKKLK